MFATFFLATLGTLLAGVVFLVLIGIVFGLLGWFLIVRDEKQDRFP